MKLIKNILMGLTLVGSLTAVSASDGSELYKKCAACHGLNGEKKALGKSKIIKDFEKSTIISALNGYKDGSYGGVMKGVMKGQISSLNDEQIESLAKYISSKK